MKKILGLSIFITLTLAGCASQKQLVPTGGSKADGTVKMSFQHGLFEVPKLSVAQGIASAKRRCEAWGYTGAEPFGGSTKQCVETSGRNCQTWQVTYEYQCTSTKVDR